MSAPVGRDAWSVWAVWVWIATRDEEKADNKHEQVQMDWEKQSVVAAAARRELNEALRAGEIAAWGVEVTLRGRIGDRYVPVPTGDWTYRYLASDRDVIGAWRELERADRGAQRPFSERPPIAYNDLRLSRAEVMARWPASTADANRRGAPPRARENAARALKQLRPPHGIPAKDEKRAALLAEVNETLDTPISPDTLVRAIEQNEKAAAPPNTSAESG